MPNSHEKEPDIILIGAGIMSATLGLLLKELEPSLTITILERLEGIAHESTDAWNNAGTGHSAFCELNYTPQLPDGSIDISKAVSIAESFERSKEFWSYLIQKKYISDPNTFINSVPHMSFVWGKKNTEYLKKRHAALEKHPLFKDMHFSDNPEQIRKWIPLVMKNRAKYQSVAATFMKAGTDVNFGSLTRSIFKHLKKLNGIKIQLNKEVAELEKENDFWKIIVKDLKTNKEKTIRAKFVFIGAGGASLTLLNKSGIPEGKGYGGFPVSGQWLVCNNEKIIQQHEAKVYGKAAIGAPPMSVPHLDTRMINGRKALLFGPYAGFTTKFLKYGSIFDLPASIKISNIRPMISAGIQNIPLTKYLIDQVRQSPEDRLKALRLFVPKAKMEDWDLEIAGQRVQIIKKDKDHGGVLEFGTRVVNSKDGSLAALLGASPGASTSVTIMLDLLKSCFPKKTGTKKWQKKILEMVPSINCSLEENEKMVLNIRKRTSKILGLKN
jgi:malate dehydrogenase (quinone)